MWLVMIAGAITLGAVEVELETLDGRKTAGTVSEWTAGEIAIQTADGQIRHAIDQIVTVRPASTRAPADQETTVWLELRDGSTLEAISYAVSGAKVKVKLHGNIETEMQSGTLAAVRLKSQDPPLATQWREIRNTNVASDLIVMRRNNALDYLEGVLGEVTADRVYFTFEGEEIPIKREKVEGLIYYRAAQPDLPQLACVVHAAAGLRIHAQRVALEGANLRVVSRVGWELLIPSDRVSLIDYSAGKIQYLSDIEPASVSWSPYFRLPDKVASLAKVAGPRFDRSLEGGPLRLGGIEYRKGLALRSRTEMTYRLPDKFRRFTAVAGIDDRVRQGGHVQLTVSSRSKTLLDTTISGADEPLEIDLDITGVRQLTILVDYGDDLDVADHLDLCEARISK